MARRARVFQLADGRWCCTRPGFGFAPAELTHVFDTWGQAMSVATLTGYAQAAPSVMVERADADLAAAAVVVHG